MGVSFSEKEFKSPNKVDYTDTHTENVSHISCGFPQIYNDHMMKRFWFCLSV